MKLDILDKYLAIWEQYLFYFEQFFQMTERYSSTQFIKVIPNTKIDLQAIREIKKLDIRRSLLFGSKVVDYSLNSLSNEYFTLYGNKISQYEKSTAFSQLAEILPIVAVWFLNSKKLYRFSENFFSLMWHTDIEEFKLADIYFPFDSYIIALPHIVNVMQDTLQISHILFQKYMALDGEWRVRVMLLGPTLMKRYDLIKTFEKRFEKSFQRNDWESYTRYFNEWLKDFYVPQIDYSFFLNPSLGEIHSMLAKTDKGIADLCLLAFKLALYFMAIDNKKDETITRREESVMFTLTSKNITVDTFEIETPYSTSFASSNTQGNKKGISISDPRFRRGYFRRKPGEGKNPHALKVVQVRPTIINKHLLSEKSLKISEQNI